jgi:hypothetical protein
MAPKWDTILLDRLHGLVNCFWNIKIRVNIMKQQVLYLFGLSFNPGFMVIIVSQNHCVDV